jgi:hypothetical protein
MAHPIFDRLKEPRVRWLIVGGVALVAVIVGGFSLAGHAGGDEDTGDGPRLSIAVVPPVEKDVQPGDVMDVGRLNDGFDGKMPEAVEHTAADADLNVEQPAYVEDDAAWRRDDRRTDDRDDAYDRARPGPDDRNRTDDRMQRDAYQDRPMSFGFDQPQPDWRAEREARRAALDARERERNAERQRRYRSDGGSSRDRGPY